MVMSKHPLVCPTQEYGAGHMMLSKLGSDLKSRLWRLLPRAREADLEKRIAVAQIRAT